MLLTQLLHGCVNSPTCQILVGCPVFVVLGLLLIIIFTIDLPDILQKLKGMHADDMKLYLPICDHTIQALKRYFKMTSNVFFIWAATWRSNRIPRNVLYFNINLK